MKPYKLLVSSCDPCAIYINSTVNKIFIHTGEKWYSKMKSQTYILVTNPILTLADLQTYWWEALSEQISSGTAKYLTLAPNKYSDQPEHPRSLIRVFVRHCIQDSRNFVIVTYEALQKFSFMWICFLETKGKGPVFPSFWQCPLETFWNDRLFFNETPLTMFLYSLNPLLWDH